MLINATIPAGLKFQYDRCHVFATQNGNSSMELMECTEWVYDVSLYKHTFTKQVVKIMCVIKDYFRVDNMILKES